MNKHLSQEQFARCFVGGSTSASGPSAEERQHLAACADCAAELDRFSNTVLSLRYAIRGRVEERVESGVETRPAAAARPRGRWVLVAATVVLLGMVPFLARKPEEPVKKVLAEPTSPDALMDAIHLHLSRTVPAPMEPMMSLIPSDELKSE